MDYLPAAQLCKKGYRLQEVTEFSEKYRLGKILHSGTMTAIARGKAIHTGEKVIVKSVYTKRYKKLKEANILKKLIQVPGVVKYLDHYHIDHSGYFLVLEYFGKMTLKRFLAQNVYPIQENDVHFIFKQIVSVVQSCFNCNILHRNLKPNNILINPETLKIKITNFNAAMCFNDEKEEIFTSLNTEIAPPEYFTKRVYEPNGLYVWSMGLLLYKMIFNREPFTCAKDVVRKPCSIQSKYPLSIDVQLLISWMLTKSPKKRPTINELAHHPWVTCKWI
jgi:serine/threonine protein kinase